MVTTYGLHHRLRRHHRSKDPFVTSTLQPASAFYRREVERLLSLADAAASSEMRGELARMAKLYQRLAEQAEKRSAAESAGAPSSEIRVDDADTSGA